MWNDMQKHIWPDVVISNHFPRLHNSITWRWTHLALHGHRATKPSPRRRGGEKTMIIIIGLFSPKRGSGALQLAGTDKYLHAGPREGQTTAALLSQTGSCRDEALHQSIEGDILCLFVKSAAARFKLFFFRNFISLWLMSFPVLLDKREKLVHNTNEGNLNLIKTNLYLFTIQKWHN